MSKPFTCNHPFRTLEASRKPEELIGAEEIRTGARGQHSQMPPRTH